MITLQEILTKEDYSKSTHIAHLRNTCITIIRKIAELGINTFHQ